MFCQRELSFAFGKNTFRSGNISNRTRQDVRPKTGSRVQLAAEGRSSKIWPQAKLHVAQRKVSAHILRMVANLTKDGLVIPRRLLRGIKRVELRRGKGRITLFPAKEVDPITQLGSKPVACGVRNGSTNHDRHLYNGRA